MPTRIEIRGVIIPNDYQWIYDLFEIEATSPAKVMKQINDANGDDLEVIINSGGGSAYSGSEIYTILKEYKGDTVGKIVGVAASAASVVAMGVKTLLMSPTAQIMIHNASVWADGDKREHRHVADFLQSVDAGIANAYRLKTGMSHSELLGLMNKETWMNAQEALEKKFIDGIMFDDGQLSAVASAGSEMIPQKVIDYLRNELLKAKASGDSSPGVSVGAMQPTANLQTLPAITPGAIRPAAVLPTPSKKDGEVKNKMDLEQLKNDHPEVYAAAVQAGVAQERARIKALDDLADASNQTIINKAKFETGVTAAEAALEIVAASKAKLQKMGQKLKNDADTSGIDAVDPEEPEDATGAEEAEANASRIADIINKRRSVSK